MAVAAALQVLRRVLAGEDPSAAAISAGHARHLLLVAASVEGREPLLRFLDDDSQLLGLGRHHLTRRRSLSPHLLSNRRLRRLLVLHGCPAFFNFLSQADLTEPTARHATSATTYITQLHRGFGRVK